MFGFGRRGNQTFTFISVNAPTKRAGRITYFWVELKKLL